MVSIVDMPGLIDQLRGFCSQQDFPLRVLSWYSHGKDDTKDVEDVKVKHLAEDKPALLRVVFAPVDAYRPATPADLLDLLNAYGLPSTFVTERLHSVPFSFGHRSTASSAHVIWFHCLCKGLKAKQPQHEPDVDHRHAVRTTMSKMIPLVHVHALQSNGPLAQDTAPNEQSNADYSWINCAFALRVVPNVNNAPGSLPSSPWSITLICFGASEQLQDRFASLLNDEHHRWKQALPEPYILFSIVFDELHKEIDNIVWNLGDMFGAIETTILNNAQKPAGNAGQIDFVGLHNISKHSIYLQESTSSLLEIIEGAIKTLEGRISVRNGTSCHDALCYNKSVVNATRARLISLDKRINNLIALSFNLVTQSDSRTLKADSKLMILIAVVTMVFLPTNTIASIFGSSFFDAELGPPTGNAVGGTLHMLPQFWLFWVVCIPITCLIMGLGFLYWQYVKRVHLAGVERHKE